LGKSEGIITGVSHDVFFLSKVYVKYCVQVINTAVVLTWTKPGKRHTTTDQLATCFEKTYRDKHHRKICISSNQVLFWKWKTFILQIHLHSLGLVV